MQSGGGVSGNERIDAQYGIHQTTKAPNAIGADINNDSIPEHSNVHIGELTWGSNPNSANSKPDNRLDIEVDWLSGGNNSNRSPFSQFNSNGVSAAQKTKQNFALYGIKLKFHNSTNISYRQARNICKKKQAGTCSEYVSPGSMSAGELNKIEDTYHNNSSRMHLLISSEYEIRRLHISLMTKQSQQVFWALQGILALQRQIPQKWEDPIWCCSI